MAVRIRNFLVRKQVYQGFIENFKKCQLYLSIRQVMVAK